MNETMTEKTEIEFYVAMNEDGEFELAPDPGDVRDLLGENFGYQAYRVVKVTMKIAAPVIDEISIDIPDTAGTTESIEVEAA